MGAPSPRTPSPAKVPEGRLDSWKEIAAYLGRDITTVQRWEKREGMPIHRHLHDKRGSVYALPSELDSWRESRKLPLQQDDTESTPNAALAGQPVPESRPRTRLHLWLALAGVAALAVLAIAYFMARGRADRAAAPKIRSLAVLPLKNLSGDPGQEYLADGMTDALIDRLAQIRDLRVISRTSVMRFKNPQISVPEIAKTLNVDAVVEGSVIRDGDRIRVTAQLIRASTDAHFWSETYDRQFRDVFSLESDVARTIAEKVEVTITGKERQRLNAARPIAPEVYEDYLQGCHQLDQGNDRARFEKAVAFFQDAVDRDPKFAPAYLGLATAYDALGSNFVGDPPVPSIRRQMSAAQKALELDPNLADAHVLLGEAQTLLFKWSDAEVEYKRALDLSPNNSYANSGHAWWLLFQGRTDEAVALEHRARQLDPLSVDGVEMGWMLWEARRYDDALHELRTVLSAQPNDPVALWDLGIVFMDQNQPQAAIPVLEKAVSASKGSPGVIGSLAKAYAQAGRRADALRLLAELNRRRKKGFVPPGAFVSAYLGLGDKDQAFAWLEQAYREHSNILRFLKVDPAFDPIRSDPRFAALLHRVALD